MRLWCELIWESLEEEETFLIREFWGNVREEGVFGLFCRMIIISEVIMV